MSVNRGRDLTYEEAGADDMGFTPAGRTCPEPNQRVMLGPQGLSQEPIGQGVARLVGGSGRLVEKVARRTRQAEGPLNRGGSLVHGSHCIPV